MINNKLQSHLMDVGNMQVDEFIAVAKHGYENFKIE